MTTEALVSPRKRKLLVVVPDSDPFRALAAYAQASLRSVFDPIDVLVHRCKSSESDFDLRRRKVGLIRAIDERLYCLIESLFTPWDKAADRIGLDPCLDSFRSVSSLRDPKFKTLLATHNYDVLLGLGCEYVPVETLPKTLTALNIHPGILPDYRGLGNPEAWLRRDFGNMGMAIHRMARRLDTGTVIIQKRIAGMKHLNIPLSYLVSYRVGIDTLAEISADLCFAPLAEFDSTPQQPANLWRMRFTLYCIGRLGRLVPHRLTTSSS